MSRAQANVLRAFSAWTVYVWGFRVFTILGDDDHSVGFKTVHTVLALVSVAFAVATWIVVARVRRSARSVPAGGDPRPDDRQPTHS